MDKVLMDIIDKYWADYMNHKNDDFVVKPSIPIVWFGDLSQYLKSKLRIVTVAINPSNVEFEAKTKREISIYGSNAFLRFKNGAELFDKDILSEDDKFKFVQTLNDYFNDEPYSNWFMCFEKRLNELNTSYYSNSSDNIAIHIDIYSSLATSPTWGGLKKINADYCERLKNKDLFKALFEYLKPDVVLYSANAAALKDVFNLDKNDILKKYAANSNCAINVYVHKNTLIISGRNWQKPFQGMTDEFITNAISNIKDNFKEYLKVEK